MVLSLPVARLAAVVLLLVAALVAEAQQQAGKVPRIGVLTFTQMTAALQEAFRQGLRDHGYVEGQNILVEWRAAEGRPDRAKALAVEAGPVERRCHRGQPHAGGASREGRDQHDPYRHGVGWRSGGDRLRGEPRTAWRQHHRHDRHLCGAVGEATRTASRTHPGPDPRWLADQCNQSVRKGPRRRDPGCCQRPVSSSTLWMCAARRRSMQRFLR